MARFHFHLHECGTVIQDEEGVEHDPADVRDVALKAARDVMAGEIQGGNLCLGCFIVVEDENRREVMRLPFRDAVAVTGL